MAYAEVVDVVAPCTGKPHASRSFENAQHTYVNGRERGWRLHSSQNEFHGVFREKRRDEPCEDLPVMVEGTNEPTTP